MTTFLTQYIVLTGGDIACPEVGCRFKDVGDTCLTATVCINAQPLPDPGEAVHCQFAGECDSFTSQDVNGGVRRIIGCIAGTPTIASTE